MLERPPAPQTPGASMIPLGETEQWQQRASRNRRPAYPAYQSD